MTREHLERNDPIQKVTEQDETARGLGVGYQKARRPPRDLGTRAIAGILDRLLINIKRHGREQVGWFSKRDNFS